MPASDPTAANALLTTMRSYQSSQALYVVAVLGIADQLADGPQDSETLARATGTDATSLYRLLRTLASCGIFAEDLGHRFTLTDAALPLRTDAPGSVRAALIVWGHPMQWLPWGKLLDSVRTGKPAFPSVFGVDHYEYLTTHAEDAAIFHAAMAGSQRHVHLAAAYDMSTARLIIDVGGGNGRLIAALLQANPHARGVLLDKPHVISAAGEVLSKAGVADRCLTIGGNFFADIPAGGDVYVFSSVIMDQRDADAITLLRACRAAMVANGRVVIVEPVIPADNTPSLAQLNDLMHLVVTGGRIRSEGEFDQLFRTCGLCRSELMTLPSGEIVMEARPV